MDDPSALAPTRAVKMAPRAALIEHRDDGSILIRSPMSLLPHPESWNVRLREWAETAPDEVFLTEDDRAGGRRTISFTQTLDAVRRIGQGLLDIGLDSEHPLAILAENSINCMLVTLAAMWVGVPASPISPAYALKAREFSKLAGVVSALAPGAIYVADGARYGSAIEGSAPERMPVISGGAPLPGRSCTLLRDLFAIAPGAGERAANAAVTGDTIAKIMFTSGSSGAPKPVVLLHRTLAVNRQQNAQLYAFLLEEPPVLVDWLPWHHTFGGNNNLGFALWCGGTLHIDSGAPDPAGVLRTIDLLAAYPPTIYLNTPGGFSALIEHLVADGQFAAKFFSRLKLIQYGGAVLPAHIWRALDEVAVAAIGERILVVSGIGSTECGPTPVQSSWEQDRKPEAGLPVPEVEAKLVPILDTFELRLRGPCVTPGYWRRPDLTDAAFDDEGFFMMGDAVQPIDPQDFARGLLFDGRISDNFKLTSGTWVQAATIRARLLAAMTPLLKDAVVTGHDRAEVGVIAFPDLEVARSLAGSDHDDDDVLTSATVRDWVRTRLRELARTAGGGSDRIARLVLAAEAPTFDNGELTDKGTAAARVVLARRAALVQSLHTDNPDAAIITLDG